MSEPVLGNLGSPCGRAKGCINVERRLYTAFSDQTNLVQVTKSSQLLCKSPQESRPGGVIASADKQKCSRVGQKSRIAGVSQPTIFSPKAQQQVETYTRSKQSQQLHRSIPLCKREWVTSIDFKDAYFHVPVQNIPVQSTSIWSVHSSFRETKEVKLMALQKGIRIHQYLDDWLIRAKSHQICLQHTQTLGSSLPGSRFVSKHGKIRTGSRKFLRLLVRPERGQGQTHPRPVADLDSKNQRFANRTDSNRKTSPLKST